jgi:hypothetical protein
MKIIALLLAIFAVARADRGWNMPKGLNVRGGADLGPLDNALALKLAKTATVAYAAGSGSKYISKQTGGSNTQVRFNPLITLRLQVNSYSPVSLYLMIINSWLTLSPKTCSLSTPSVPPWLRVCSSFPTLALTQ